MNIKAFIWEQLFDPFVRRIESRIAHYQGLRSITHDGSRWKGKAVIGESVVFYTEAELFNLGERDNLFVSNNTHIRGEILVYESGEFKIGTHSYLGPGSRIWCRQSIMIGSHVQLPGPR